MWLTRLQDSILNQEIEVATNASWGQSKTLTNCHSGRWPVLEDRAGDRIAGAEVVDFHNSIVS
jgi:hypothetical protein